MAFELSTLAQSKIQGSNIEPSLVLEIDGVTEIFGIGTVQKHVRIGDAGLEIGDDWIIGGTNNVDDQIDSISFDGTSTTITQQINQDKGGASSVSSIAISLIDKNDRVTEIISPGNDVDDLMGRKARVYLGFSGTAYPDDYEIIFSGIIDEVTSGGTIVINVAHPESKKRIELFPKVDTVLLASVTNSDTTLYLESNANMIDQVVDVDPALKTYLRIDDEIIEYSSFNTEDGGVEGLVRGSLGTVAAAHDEGATVTTLYRLQGNPIQLALKLLMSTHDDDLTPAYYASDIPVGQFGRIGPDELNEYAIYFDGVDIAKRYGVVIGDTISIQGSSEGNDILDTISDIQIVDGGSYITTETPLTIELDTDATARFRSKYHTLPTGAGLSGDEVDIAEFERIEAFMSSNLFTYDYYIKDTMNLKEFIDTKLLYPSGLFSLPRKGRISLGVNGPPLAVSTLTKLTAANVTNPDQTRIRRTINKYFYNSIVYKYNEDALEDKFLSGYITVDEDSKSQIRVGTRALTIAAGGIRPSSDTTAILRSSSLRLLDRYKYAAEELKVSVFYGAGMTMEVGDVVLYGDPALRMPDSKTASRNFVPRLFEIVNKSMNIKSGKIDLTLVDTNYLTEGRFGVFAPSSKTGTGSTPTQLVIKRSYGTPAGRFEKSKWTDYVGETILIHANDWSAQYETKFNGFLGGNPNVMLIDSIGVSVPEDYIVEIPNYPDTDEPRTHEIYKNVHCFFDPSIEIASNTDEFNFVVSSGDETKFTVGCKILVRSEDWSVVSSEGTVMSVTGTTVTHEGLGMTPSAGQFVEIIGFKDGGGAYRWI